jgi:hypothetical protein
METHSAMGAERHQYHRGVAKLSIGAVEAPVGNQRPSTI